MNYPLSLPGRALAVLVTASAGAFLTARQPALTLEFAGIPGDRHYGLTMPSDNRTPHYPRGTEISNSRQVSLVSVEELQVVAQALGLAEIAPEWLGANLVTAGIPALTRLPPLSRLRFEGGVTLLTGGENMPCRFAGAAVAQGSNRPGIEAQFIAAAMHRRGVTAWVEKPGIIREGEVFTADIPEQAPYLPPAEG